MEELIQKIEELIIVVENNGVPVVLTWVGILFPIIISILVIIQTAIQASRNKKFQKYISDREVKVQMHTNFLNIYDAFCTAQNTIGKARDNISVIFSNQNDAFQWTNELITANNGVCQAMNRAHLLLPTSDKQFLEVLKNAFEEYKELTSKVIDYTNTGTAEFYRNQTWSKICQTYNIAYGDYMALSNNPIAYQDFMKLYSNKETEVINVMIKDILPLFEYDKFDKYFEKYLRVDA